MRLAVPYEPETELVAEHFGHAKWKLERQQPNPE